MRVLIILFTASLWAAPNSADLYEKTFPRDNTYCKMGSKRIEFSLRGFSKYTEPRDRGYGEILFLEDGSIRKPIDISQGDSGLFRFFRGTANICSKYQAYNIDEDTFALLLQKANRPHKDKLVIQLFNRKKNIPLKLFSTDILADRSLPAPDGFYIRTNGERLDVDMGTIVWDEKKFTYQDRDFQEWMHFTKNGLSLSPETTYNEFPFKSYFTDETEFYKVTGWSPEEKKFANKILYVAVNHSIKKECIILLPGRQKLNGSEEGWRCRQK